MMHTFPFISSEPILFEKAIFRVYGPKNTLHFCEGERSWSPSIDLEPLSTGSEYVVLELDWGTTVTFHNKPLEMENQRANESCEASTLESVEKDSMDEHGTVIFEIPCSFNFSPESGRLSAPCTHEDYNHLKVLFCKIFTRLVIDVYVYRKHCIFRVALWHWPCS